MYKKLLSVVISFIMLLVGSISCFGIEIDGVINNKEWSESKVFSFEHPDGFNNDVTFAVIRLMPDYDSYQLDVAIAFNVSEFTYYSDTAVALSFDSENEILLYGDGICEYDKSLYSVDFAAIGEESQSRIFYEIKIGIKHGFSDVDSLQVSLWDCNGEPSNVFEFDLTQIGLPVTTIQSTQQEASQNESTEKNTTTKSKKTDKTKKDSSNKSDSDDYFPFEKVEIDEEITQDVSADINGESETDETVDLTDRPVSNSEVKKKLFTGVAILCTGLILTSAVYIGIKRSKKSGEDKQ